MEAAMKKLFTLLALVLAAALTAPQDAKPTGKERQFVGEVVSANVDVKTLTLKVAGRRLERRDAPSDATRRQDSGRVTATGRPRAGGRS